MYAIRSYYASIQLLLVHESIVGEVEKRLTGMVKALPYGDPYDSKTVVGPLISEPEAVRVENWIEEAVSRGARRLAGGPRQGAVVPPTLLASIDDSIRITSYNVCYTKLLRCTPPTSSLRPAANASSSRLVKIPHASPYGVALTRAIAASSVSNGTMLSSGPNTSRHPTFIESSIDASRVGGTTAPWLV